MKNFKNIFRVSVFVLGCAFNFNLNKVLAMKELSTNENRTNYDKTNKNKSTIEKFNEVNLEENKIISDKIKPLPRIFKLGVSGENEIQDEVKKEEKTQNKSYQIKTEKKLDGEEVKKKDEIKNMCEDEKAFSSEEGNSEDDVPIEKIQGGK